MTMPSLAERYWITMAITLAIPLARIAMRHIAVAQQRAERDHDVQGADRRTQVIKQGAEQERRGDAAVRDLIRQA